MDNVLVIGAGIAGLFAAQRLKQTGLHVRVLDKGRGVGGRMATRRLPSGWRADHGAQYVTGRTPEFSQLLADWEAQGALQRWFDRLAFTDGTREEGNSTPRFVGVQGMTTVPKVLAAGLTVQTGCRIVRLKQTETGWQAHSETGEPLAARALIVTCPIPQTLALLADSGLRLAPQQMAALEAITYAPCWTLMLEMSRDAVRLPEPGGVKSRSEETAIGWIADNGQKAPAMGPEKPAETTVITLQAGPQWSEAHWDDTPESVLDALLMEASPWLERDGLVDWQAHRWRYAFPVNPLQEACFPLTGFTAPIVLAGDAFGGRGKVETAALSGLAAASVVKSTMTQPAL